MEEDEDDKDDKDDKEGAARMERLLKERRFLLVISVVLLAHQFLGITVGQSTESFGLHFEITRPERVWLIIWLVWGWTAICYLQQLNTIRPGSQYPRKRESEIRDRLAQRIAFTRVRKQAMSYLRKIILEHLRPSFKARPLDEPFFYTESNGSRVVWFQVNVFAEWNCTDPNSSMEYATSFDKAMQEHGWTADVGGVGYMSGRCNLSRVVKVRFIPIRDEVVTRYAAAGWAILSTSFVTDLIAPLIIAAAPIVVELTRLARRIIP